MVISLGKRCVPSQISLCAAMPYVEVDVKALRKRLGYSQAQFSRRFGVAIDAVQDWDQHRRMPDRTARILLKVVEGAPDAVSRALAR